MANLNDLGLTNEDLGLDYSNIPEERGEIVPPLQPGAYVFQLPSNLSSVWDTITRNGEQRVQAVLTNDQALTVFLPGNTQRTFNAYISNAAFPRGVDKILVSDMQYALRILEPSAAPKTNVEFVKVFSQQAGKKFKATVEWTAYCNPEKTAYFENPETGRAEEDPNSHGCAQNTWQNAIPRDAEGQYETRFSCVCGAVLRPFPKLRNYRSVE